MLKAISGSKFEGHAYQYLKRCHKAKDGLQVEHHPQWWHHPAAYRRIPDFVVTRTRFGKHAVIAEAIHVQQLLGHKSIQNTMVYINLEQAVFRTEDDEFHVKVAHNVDEACKLVEVGFEYVTGSYADGGRSSENANNP